MNVRFENGQGVFVTLALRSPEDKSFHYGQLAIRWVGANPAAVPQRAQLFAGNQIMTHDTSEEILRSLIEGLPGDKRREIGDLLAKRQPAAKVPTFEKTAARLQGTMASKAALAAVVIGAGGQDRGEGLRLAPPISRAERSQARVESQQKLLNAIKADYEASFADALKRIIKE
jgi:hypothetical protein